MPHRRRFRLLTALLLAPAATAGCASDGKTAGGPPGFPWVVESDVPGSREDLKNASRLDLSYAQWQEQLGNIPEAEQSYQRVLKENPKSIDALLGLARLEQLAGRTAEAEQAFRRAVDSAPGNPQALDALGQFYAAEQRWPEAIATLGRAAEAAPDDPVYRHHYAVALARSGDTGRALAEFTKAVGEAEAHYNVGYILYEQGRTDLAEREFRQAVVLRPDLTAAQAMLDELRRGGADALAQIESARPAGVTQTAAVAASRWNRQVKPASLPPATAFPAAAAAAPSPPAAPPDYPRGPAAQPAMAAAPTTPPVTTPAAPEPLPAAPPAPMSPAATSHEPLQWQTPTRRDPAAIFAEQMRNQAPLPQ